MRPVTKLSLRQNRNDYGAAGIFREALPRPSPKLSLKLDPVLVVRKDSKILIIILNEFINVAFDCASWSQNAVSNNRIRICKGWPNTLSGLLS